MRLRKLGAGAIALLAVTGLSSCDSKVGQAAVVQGHRLSDSDLSAYIQTGAKSYTDKNSGATVVPKLYALENWIDDQLFERAVESRGGRVTAPELRLTRGLVVGSGSPEDISTFYTKLGYTERFAKLFLHEQQMVVLLVKRLVPKVPDSQIISALQSGQLGGALLGAVKKVKANVSVSARYGKWDASKLALTDTPGAGLPSFITFLAQDAAGTANVPATSG